VCTESSRKAAKKMILILGNFHHDNPLTCQTQAPHSAVSNYSTHAQSINTRDASLPMSFSHRWHIPSLQIPYCREIYISSSTLSFVWVCPGIMASSGSSSFTNFLSLTCSPSLGATHLFVWFFF
jgi:hypothetical protein